MKQNAFYLIQIDRCFERILEYTKEGRDSFFSSTMQQDAVIRNLQMISIAAGKIADEHKDKYNFLPWREIRELNRVLLYVDKEALWNTVEQHAENLRQSFRRIPREGAAATKTNEPGSN